MTFHVGQKVVCVDDRPARGPFAAGIHGLIRKGIIYTIRDIDRRAEHIHGGPCIRLDEVVVEEIDTRVGLWEPGYAARRFRPVIERKTDISIFTELLTPKVREREDART